MKNPILFVDDEPKLLSAIGRMLDDQEQWDLHFAQSAQQALQALATRSFDVAVLDIKMPIRNGLELLSDIKADPALRNVEVIMLTGHAEIFSKRQALEMGAADLLNKPILREDLLARLNSTLRLKAYQDDLRQRNLLLQERLLQSQRVELMGRLGAGATENLDQILSLILSNTSRLACDLAAQESAPSQSMQELHDSVANASKIVRQIRVLGGGAPADRQRCALDQALESWLTLVGPSYVAGYEITWDKPTAPCWIQANESQLAQLMMNLVLIASRVFASRRRFYISIKEIRSKDFQVPTRGDTPARTFWRLRLSENPSGRPGGTPLCFKGLQSINVNEGGLALSVWVAQQIAGLNEGLVHIESDEVAGDFLDVYLPQA